MKNGSLPGDRDDYAVRAFAVGDAKEVDRLAREGLLADEVDHSDEATASDPHGSGAGHPDPRSFWVVESGGRMVGTIAMVKSTAGIGRLLQLRVAPALQGDPRVVEMLVRAAIEQARHRGMLKVVIESPRGEGKSTGSDQLPMVAYLRSLGFEYTRTYPAGGRMMLEFYLNLYEGPA